MNEAAAKGDDAPRDLLSVLVPVYNEQEVLRSFYDALRQSVDPLDMDCEILFVNDGSDDSTSVLIHELHRSDPDVAILDLSRNFGKEIALTAGLRLVSGDAVVVLDADLQDPPELIPELVAQWREGYDMVLARRRKRRGDPWIKRTTAGLFYRLMRHIGDVELPQDVGDFRLLSRRAISAINSFEEHNRFMKGLFAWIGFKQTTVYYERAARRAGETKWNFGRLWKLALEGITSFTTAPLRVSTYIGLTTALGSFAYGLFIVVRTLLFGDPVPGYPSLITIVLFLGGIQLMSIGIMGEYIGRIFTETKRRPLYLVDRHFPARSSTNRANRS